MFSTILLPILSLSMRRAWAYVTTYYSPLLSELSDANGLGPGWQNLSR